MFFGGAEVTATSMFLAEHLPAGWQGLGALPPAERDTFATTWKRTLNDHGLMAITWPKEYGGSDLPLLDRVVLGEELMKAGAAVWDISVEVSMNLIGRTIREPQKSLDPFGRGGHHRQTITPFTFIENLLNLLRAARENGRTRICGRCRCG